MYYSEEEEEEEECWSDEQLEAVLVADWSSVSGNTARKQTVHNNNRGHYGLIGLAHVKD